ncbi:MAG: amino acid adenylation domain-containing protein, partial [Gammaproteobacteria bacterium]|nr:amino acid adenylation domain-containing protein [Gammaproteobacteria bacterium]
MADKEKEGGEHLAYWQEELAGDLPILDFPIDKMRAARSVYTGKTYSVTLPEVLTHSLRQLAEKEEVSLFMLLLGLYKILLYRYTHQNDIIIGVPVAGGAGKRVEHTEGHFINMMALRSHIEGTQLFSDYLEKIKRVVTRGLEHSVYPFSTLVSELNKKQHPAHSPVFQTSFILQNFLVRDDEHDLIAKYGDLEILSEVHQAGELDLRLALIEKDNGLDVKVCYNADIFYEETIIHFTKHYALLAQAIINDPGQRVDQYSFLSEEERHTLLVEWNNTKTDYPKDKTIQQLFQAQVKKTPDNIALVFEDKQLTYQELNQQSNQLARYIRNRYQRHTGNPLKPDTLITLCLDRSLDMVIGILATLKAGGAYVPIDPYCPAARITFMVNDTQSKMLLTQSHLKNRLQPCMGKEVALITIESMLYKEESLSNLTAQSNATDLAYVIYTSGTTGQPKGVMLTHQGVINHIDWMQKKYPLSSGDKILQKTPYIFDVSVCELLWANWYGGCLVMLKPEGHKDSEYLIHLIEQHGITHLHSVPSMLEGFNHTLEMTGKHYSQSLRYLFCSGELLTSTLSEQTYQLCQSNHLAIHNLYGPTEASIEMTYFACERGKPVKLGRPIQNTRLYVLDENHSQVPMRVVGELYIGGMGLARGYLNQPELTKERFIENIFATESDKKAGYARLYKTGDLVKWLPDGNLEYIGRSDFQVKIRGFRIELGEIENTLSSYPEIKQVAVLAKVHSNDTAETRQYLIAYYVSEHVITDEILIEHLDQSLPDYMIPSAFMRLESFPLTVNGKLDRKALPELVWQRAEENYVAPSSELEHALCQIWQAVLDLERVGIKDDFFRIGGDSILTIQLSSRLRQAGYTCNVKAIFAHRTVEQLAQHLASEQAAIETYTEQGVLEGTFDLLPIQSWFFDQVEAQHFNAPHHWNQSFLVKVPALDREQLQSCIAQLAAHHDMLRVTYESVHQQTYHASIALPELKTLDVSDVTTQEQSERLTQWQSHFNREAGPLWQMGYLHGYQDGSARIYFAFHHLIIDTVSWRVLIEDIQQLYQGKSLPEKTSSYRQWVKTVKTYTKTYPSEHAYWIAQMTQLPDYEQYREKIKDGSQTISYQQSHFALDQQTTQQLLEHANQAYHTETNDLLLTVLAYTLQDWQGDSIQGVTLEGLGREAIDAHVDTSRTVGWFTTMYPVKLEVKASLRDSIKHMKEGLRAIPHKGLGHGAFPDQQTRAVNHPILPPISFNYLEPFDSQADFWQLTSEPSGLSMHSDNRDQNLISINAKVINKQLKFNVVTQLSAAQTQRMTRFLEQQLRKVIAHCQAIIKNKAQEYTPSDFDAMSVITQQALDKVMENTDSSIENIYPASQMQSLMIQQYTHHKEGVYHPQKIYKLRKKGFSIKRFTQTLNSIVNVTPIFRSYFVRLADQRLVQIVKKTHVVNVRVEDISHLPLDQQEEKINDWLSKDRARLFDAFATDQSLLRLHVMQLSEGNIALGVSFHHAIIDGWSDIEFMKQLFYSGSKPSANTYKIFVQQEQKVLDDKKIKHYWQRSLSAVNPVLLTLRTDRTDSSENRNELPVNIELVLVERLLILGKQRNVSIKSILLSAFSLAISQFIGRQDSIVGVITNGRTDSLPNSLTAIGMFWNIIPFHMQFNMNTLETADMQITHRRLIEVDESYGRYPLPQLLNDINQQELFFATFNYIHFHHMREIPQEIVDNEMMVEPVFFDRYHYPLNLTVSRDANNDSMRFYTNFDERFISSSDARSIINNYLSILKMVVDET